MRFFATCVALVLAPAAALAQQPTPTQQALSVDSLIGVWATGYEQAQAIIPVLNKQVKELQDKAAAEAKKTADAAAADAHKIDALQGELKTTRGQISDDQATIVDLRRQLEAAAHQTKPPVATPPKEWRPHWPPGHLRPFTRRPL